MRNARLTTFIMVLSVCCLHPRAMSLMNEEPNTKETQSEEQASASTSEAPTVTVPKMLVDKPTDFRFHAAYLVYSDAWDRASSGEAKQKLNESITALSSEQIDYETFYQQVSQYRVEFNPEHFSGRGGRSFIETQRKKDWRKREERASRNKRHGR